MYLPIVFKSIGYQNLIIQVDNYQNMKSIPLILFGATIVLSLKGISSLQPVSQEIITQIFQKYKIYMIYITEENDLLMESYFNEYCQTGYLCAVLNKSSHLYETVFAYIGKQQSQFFLIIDSARKKKYVMPINQNMTVTDIRIFEAKFQQGLLEPFYASEKPQMNSYLPCRKIVGQNLDQFLGHEAPLKVLYLYSDQNFCHSCGELLRNYADFAQGLYDPKMVIFGYYDILKNDHPKILDEKNPHFLIFTEPGAKPIDIEGEQFSKMQQKIIELATSRSSIKIKSTSASSSKNSQIVNEQL